MKDTSLLAAQIRAARAILGWSQAYLAEGANVNKSTIVEWPLKPYVPVGIRQKEVRSAPPPHANAGAESIKNLVSSRTGRKLYLQAIAFARSAKSSGR